jgi:hypothetical protein
MASLQPRVRFCLGIGIYLVYYGYIASSYGTTRALRSRKWRTITNQLTMFLSVLLETIQELES